MTRCERRYPVGGKRDEPFEVTYRCGLELGHDGRCGSEPEPSGTLCEKCNHYIQMGEHPFCPHEPTHAMIIRDEIPGGMWLENYGPKPIKVYSHTERRLVMDKNGLIEKDVFCPFPGTDKDPAGIPNPKGYVDKQTLENGAILLTRGRKDPEPADVPVRQFNITGTDRDAIAVQAGEPRRSARIGRRTNG